MFLFLGKRIICEEEKSDCVIPKKKLKFLKSPLEDSIVSDVDEGNEPPLDILSAAITTEKVLGKCGIWGETFFFKPDDSRLKGILKF